MATYMELINKMRTMDKPQLRDLVDRYAAAGLKGIKSNTTLNGREAHAAILTTLLAAICADGYFNTDEYYVAKPALDAFIADGITYEQTLAFIKSAAIDSTKTRNAVDNFVDTLDPETKACLVLACAAICAADKDLKPSELSWLDRLVG